MPSNEELIRRTMGILEDEIAAYLDGKIGIASPRLIMLQTLIDHLNLIEARQAAQMALVLARRRLE